MRARERVSECVCERDLTHSRVSHGSKSMSLGSTAGYSSKTAILSVPPSVMSLQAHKLTPQPYERLEIECAHDRARSCQFQAMSRNATRAIQGMSRTARILPGHSRPSLAEQPAPAPHFRRPEGRAAPTPAGFDGLTEGLNG